jgi:hypothetical protein
VGVGLHRFLLSKDEAKFVFEKGCEELIIGSGQIGNVHLSPEAEAYFAKKGCKVLLQPTPEAIRVFNEKGEWPTSSHFALACPFMTWSASARGDAEENILNY